MPHQPDQSTIQPDIAALGLQRGAVRFQPPQPEWAAQAKLTIRQLQACLGPLALDIQHVGSTAIPGLMAKPILDIAAVVRDLADLQSPDCQARLQAQGFLLRPCDLPDQLLLARGDYSRPDGRQTHFIHVVPAGSLAWRNYLNFRDFLTAHPQARQAYQILKQQLADAHPDAGGRGPCTAGKAGFIRQTLREALLWRCLGQRLTLTIDRPLGSRHPERPTDPPYPVNYGYLPGITAPDGEALDAYILGPEQPLTQFTGRAIAAVCRRDDCEDKLIVIADEDDLQKYTADRIMAAVHFQEQYFDSRVVFHFN
ncbi:MAG: GrpB family protein [Oscillospiraceae bacterium]|nr:GrpB family protein [Oscillospiraceae bacterium]MDD4368996.1 GrpB family protein [Oscillospiraceae bacterium]